MTTLLRNTRNGLYFHGPDKWTDDPNQGFDFKFIDLALRYVKDWQLEDVELAFAFDNPLQITAMSLEKATWRYAEAA